MLYLTVYECHLSIKKWSKFEFLFQKVLWVFSYSRKHLKVWSKTFDCSHVDQQIYQSKTTLPLLTYQLRRNSPVLSKNQTHLVKPVGTTYDNIIAKTVALIWLGCLFMISWVIFCLNSMLCVQLTKQRGNYNTVQRRHFSCTLYVMPSWAFNKNLSSDPTLIVCNLQPFHPVQKWKFH